MTAESAAAFGQGLGSGPGVLRENIEREDERPEHRDTLVRKYYIFSSRGQ
jgi:hypothetical protein